MSNKIKELKKKMALATMKTKIEVDDGFKNFREVTIRSLFGGTVIYSGSWRIEDCQKDYKDGLNELFG